MMSALSRVKALDQTSDRGERSVGIGFADPGAKQALMGFEFVEGIAFTDVVKKDFSVDPLTGVISFTGIDPTTEINYPNGATHVSFVGGWVKVDFATGQHELKLTNSVNLALNSAASTVTLTPNAVPLLGTGVSVYLVKVEFYQQFNGKQYALKSEEFNVLTIADLA